MNAPASPEKIDSMVEPSDGPLISAVEAGIRDFIRHDVARPGRPTSGLTGSPESVLDQSPEVTANTVNALIRRVAGVSISEIEKLIAELEGLRDLLHAEGERVQREISGYAQLSQAAMKSTRLIADNVMQWKGTADGARTS